jgi:hypothetical protein
MEDGRRRVREGGEGDAVSPPSKLAPQD